MKNRFAMKNKLLSRDNFNAKRIVVVSIIIIIIVIVISSSSISNNNNNNTLFQHKNVFGIGRIALSPMLNCINLNHNYLLILLFNHLLKKKSCKNHWKKEFFTYVKTQV